MRAVEPKNVKTRYNLPEEIRFCKKCTISNQRPRITFDENGVCSACNYAVYKQTKVDWALREKELKELLEKHRRDDGNYDVLVPSSGGKDSAFIAHELKYKYGMNPLTVTWSPHLYTEIGWKNFQNMIHIGGLDNILSTPNGAIHRRLTKLSFEVLGDPFQPFIFGQYNYPLQIAAIHKIPLVMYGENGEVEYGGDMKNAYTPTRDYRGDQKKHYFSNLPPEEMTEYGISKNDLFPYLSPPLEDLDKINTEIHFYGYYKKWVPQENYYYCVENTGFTANPVRNEGTYSKYASLDDQLDGFHYYLMFIKFGIGRATSDSAHEIRDGHLTREEGVQLVRKFDGEFPKKYFDIFLKYCDITEEYFNEVIDSWRGEHIWSKENGVWKLNKQVE
ncbi:N-acetyl sugar amidotransferase [Leptospira sp. FAT2]|uniref:N-acetyl sugar amidotransferase n=1 Tax=Leptospira sanjuanensis TaxID=2879643 RepID=UPI001EE82F98|nr:N-acetyl sugar amidotransferase [Leptospira sanjuanensis]MCG6167605.1 N-acetyl sugar amidotransferase [Leptospira sanjuanensis]MCG6193024.1 N-acetyl sugar amidotransferase [Leptospira sanjuanensis]